MARRPLIFGNLDIIYCLKIFLLILEIFLLLEQLLVDVLVLVPGI